MSLKTIQLRSLIDPKKTILTFRNSNRVNISMFHEEAQVKQLFAVLTLAETQQLINTLQSYIDEDLPPRGTMTDGEVMAKFKKRVTL